MPHESKQARRPPAEPTATKAGGKAATSLGPAASLTRTELGALKDLQDAFHLLLAFRPEPCPRFGLPIQDGGTDRRNAWSGNAEAVKESRQKGHLCLPIPGEGFSSAVTWKAKKGCSLRSQQPAQ